jgi:hypothetical protein
VEDGKDQRVDDRINETKTHVIWIAHQVETDPGRTWNMKLVPSHKENSKMMQELNVPEEMYGKQARVRITNRMCGW